MLTKIEVGSPPICLADKDLFITESYLTKGTSRPLKTWIFWKLALVETLAFRWQQSPACSPPRWWSCGCRTRCTSPPGRWSSSRRSWIRDSCHGWPGCHDAEMENLSSDRNIFVLSSNIEIDNILEKWKQFSSQKKFFWSWLTSCRWLERIKPPVSAPIRESLQNRKITLVTGHLHVFTSSSYSSHVVPVWQFIIIIIIIITANSISQLPWSCCWREASGEDPSMILQINFGFRTFFVLDPFLVLFCPFFN